MNIFAENDPEKVLLAIAHPDDETMFFLPTLKKLSEKACLHVISFSSGDYDGLGEVRKKELQEACKLIGIQHVTVIEDDQLQDGMSNKWPLDLIGDLLGAYIQDQGIDTVLTFDEYGVSAHPNHIDVSRGVQRYFEEERWKSQSLPENKELCFYVLESTNILRKYSGILESLLTLMLFWILSSASRSSWMGAANIQAKENKSANKKTILETDGNISKYKSVFLNWNIFLAYNVMSAHRSQFVWYRRLFTVFSRYAYMNSWKKLGKQSKIKKA
mmetsp:Transcript_21720/g.28120  ORF Transcript_21720/g.28120 Transcript_21720/m.28120 type:complete len:272 (+) Transcript_21720:185-1000(+)